MATYAFLNAPQPFDLTTEKNKSILLQSLAESRASVISGAFLTKANVVSGTLQPLGNLDLCMGIHQFPGTMVARATVTINVRQTVPSPVSASVPPSAPVTAPVRTQTIIKSINVPELVFGFKENPAVFFVVPRDSTLEMPEPKRHLYTFLTLRNQPGGTTLEHQVIPVTFDSTPESDCIVDVMRTHINKYQEVKDKMANAFRHIPKMQVKYIDLTLETTTVPQQIAPDVTGPGIDQGRKRRGKAPRDEGENSVKKPRKARVKKEEKEPVVKTKREKRAKETPTASPSTNNKATKKQKKASMIPEGWKCELCGVATTVMRRRGPSGLNCACNSCGQAWAQGNRARPKEVVAPVDEAT